jgi:alpha-L-arabinofuranosidase
VNGPDKQTVAPVDGSGITVTGGRLKGEIAPLSYRMIRLGQ